MWHGKQLLYSAIRELVLEHEGQDLRTPVGGRAAIQLNGVAVGADRLGHILADEEKNHVGTQLGGCRLGLSSRRSGLSSLGSLLSRGRQLRRIACSLNERSNLLLCLSIRDRVNATDGEDCKGKLAVLLLNDHNWRGAFASDDAACEIRGASKAIACWIDEHGEDDQAELTLSGRKTHVLMQMCETDERISRKVLPWPKGLPVGTSLAWIEAGGEDGGDVLVGGAVKNELDVKLGMALARGEKLLVHLQTDGIRCDF